MFSRKLFLVAFFGLMVVGLNRLSPAIAALSVGPELGGNFTGALDINGTTKTSSARVLSNTVDPSLLSGLTVEYYFINKGVLKYNWPTWMKNFSVAMNFTHNTIAFGRQTAKFIYNDPDWGTVTLPEFKGNVFTFSFLFKYRVPLLRQTDFPDGRLFFYLGAGPGFSFSCIEANNTALDNKTAVGHGNATAATFVAETGFSLFVVRDISIDLFFRYRYLIPKYEFNIGIDGPPLYVSFTNNTYNAALRIAFHF